MMSKVVNWKGVAVVCRMEICDREGDSKTLLTLYRPDKAIEKRYEVSVSVNVENIFAICEEQLSEFVALDNNSQLSDSSQGVFLLNSERDAAWESMRSGNLEQALMIFNSILLNDLQDPIRHLDHSRALLELLEYKEAIDGFKKVVTLVRRRKRFPKSSSSQEDEVIERKFVGERYVLYAAYTGLGKSYEGTERGDRAIACYTLALKSIRPKDSNFDGDSWDHFFVGDCEISLSRLLSASTTAAAGSVLPPHRPTLAGAQQPVVDIEDYLQDFSLTPIEGQFRFSCTSCGECCRTSDRILLSPQDIFRLTRSSALGFLGITTTTSLLAHSRFQGVFHYTKREGYPVCYLRPVKEKSHCRFAYPLYVRKDSTETSDDSSNDIVPFEEADGLTDLGVAVARHEEHWTPMMNQSGRQSLGCMLGMSGMPTLCASFPIAPELSQVDFWHVRRVFWRGSRPLSKPLSLGYGHAKGKSGDVGLSTELLSQRMASGWQNEESYVFSRTKMCEGFEETEPRHGNEDSKESRSKQKISNPPHTIRSFLSSSPGNPQIQSRLVEEESSTMERWEETQWFFGLVEDVSSFLSTDSIRFSSVQQSLLNKLALIWYNFDSLPTAKARPIRSYRRLKKEIEALTWILVKETKSFLTQAEEGEQEEAAIFVAYQDLLGRLQI